MNQQTVTLDSTPSVIQELLQQLVQQSIVLAEDLQLLSVEDRTSLMMVQTVTQLVDKLLMHKLITPYLAERIASLKTFGLVLGNYRILDRLGSGGMGVVFKAEHIRLRRPAAIKVMTSSSGAEGRLLTRFYAETRAIARIEHPNIVSAIDVGEAFPADPLAAPLHYFVMEFVPGRDLESAVVADGPMSPAKACSIVVQIAEALAEAHRQDLIHRDIKPSNILVTESGQAKLLDFGLARHFTQRLTQPGTILGTIGYMAPEQAKDASQVDLRADIYSLGATLFWCVTGRDPFPSTGQVSHDLAARLTLPPPSARQICPQIPTGLDLAISRMMAVNPDERYPTALAVTRALVPFLKKRSSESSYELHLETNLVQPLGSSKQCAFTRRVLIVDDESVIRDMCRRTLMAEGITCQEAGSGLEALELLHAMPFDLMLLDVNLPDCLGSELLQHVRSIKPESNLKIVMMSGQCHGDEMAQLLLSGADDYLAKPFSLMQLQARVRSCLRLKEAQERTQQLHEKLLATNADLEQSLSVQEVELASARQMLVQAFTDVMIHRGAETVSHMCRLQRYCRVLGTAYAAANDDIPNLDEAWLRRLEMAAPLHDLGMITLPDHILMKPGKLEDNERLLLQAHPTAGGDLLQNLANQHQFARELLQMAADIARCHHERFDGSGYPEGLRGHDIPLAARILALADVYDALRSRRSYKPALSHKMAMITILNAQQEQFDPGLLQHFNAHHEMFDQIYRDHS
jgi:response regulator RpfG family c-di-GMP phosphodiesterase